MKIINDQLIISNIEEEKIMMIIKSNRKCWILYTNISVYNNRAVMLNEYQCAERVWPKASTSTSLGNFLSHAQLTTDAFFAFSLSFLCPLSIYSPLSHPLRQEIDHHEKCRRQKKDIALIMCPVGGPRDASDQLQMNVGRRNLCHSDALSITWKVSPPKNRTKQLKKSERDRTPSLNEILIDSFFRHRRVGVLVTTDQAGGASRFGKWRRCTCLCNLSFNPFGFFSRACNKWRVS